MIDVGAVNAAVEEIRPMLTGDGADLLIDAIDAASGSVDLRLVIGESACVTCVVEPQMLHEIIREHLQRSVPGFTWANIADPRVQQPL
ncbi:MAG: NifU family protein [Gammaproteobacteria bacterium]